MGVCFPKTQSQPRTGAGIPKRQDRVLGYRQVSVAGIFVLGSREAPPTQHDTLRNGRRAFPGSLKAGLDGLTWVFQAIVQLLPEMALKILILVFSTGSISFSEHFGNTCFEQLAYSIYIGTQSFIQHFGARHIFEFTLFCTDNMSIYLLFYI